MIQFLLHSVDTGIEFLVSPPSKKFQWGNLISLGILFAAGFYQWCNFLNWGRGPFDFHDWSEITLPRLIFLKDALTQGLLPLHIANTSALGGITTRFMAIPDVILSPHIALLRYFDLRVFIIFHLFLMYTLGFWGLLRLRKKFGLSILAFTVMDLLFNFNGHLLAHFSVGHFTWGGNFLFSWFMVLVCELIEGNASWRWVARISILLSFMWLQGSYHQFIWCILFMLFLALFSINNIVTIAKGIAFSMLTSAVRLLPPFLLLGQFNNKFITGYVNASSILNSLVRLQLPLSQSTLEEVSTKMSSWESTHFIGIMGAAFLIYFGLWRGTINSHGDYIYKILLLPALCLILLSMEWIYLNLRELLPIPLLTGERVSSRMVNLALVIILFLATIEFQCWLDQVKASKVMLYIPVILLLIGINDLRQNLIQWSILRAADGFAVQGYTTSQWYVANNWGDTQYLFLIALGAVISLVSLMFLAYKIWKENNSSQSILIRGD